MTKVLQFKGDNGSLNFMIQPFCAPYVKYDNFMNYFRILKPEERMMNENGLIVENEEIDIFDILNIAIFYAQNNDFDKALDFYNIAYYPKKEIKNKIIKNKFVIFRTFCDSSMKYYYRYFEIMNALLDNIEKNIGKIIPDSKMVRKRTFNGLIPILLIQIKGEHCVVVVNKTEVDKHTKRLLETCLKNMKVKKGYLLAPRLKEGLKLEPHLHFIAIQRIEK